MIEARWRLLRERRRESRHHIGLVIRAVRCGCDEITLRLPEAWHGQAAWITLFKRPPARSVNRPDQAKPSAAHGHAWHETTGKAAESASGKSSARNDHPDSRGESRLKEFMSRFT